ncbi:Sec1 family protein [Cooperia oncophora]
MSYYAINDPSTSDDQMAAFIDSVADGLFAVCATMGIVPIIRCPKDNAAEHVAKRLDQKLRDNLRDARNNLFTIESVRAGQLNASRPLLIIADRSADLATMLHHTWTYQALVHDVLASAAPPLELDQNRVTVAEKSGKKKEYDMSSGGTDKLWTKHKGSAFPLVAEAVQEDLEAYRNSEDEIKRLKHAMGMDGTDADAAMTSLLSDTTAKLGSTVTSLPQLLEAKRLIDLHTNVATTLLDHIKQRKLDVLFELEQKLLQHSPLEIPLLQLLSNITNPEDILRVILINYLCQENISKAELEEQMNFLRERAVDESALRFVQKMRSISQLGRTAPEEHQGAGTKTISMFNKLLSHSSRFVMEGVKNLVPKKHNLPLTRVSMSTS